VHAAATVAEALACVESFSPELIVLDVDLGGEDGLALLPALSRHAHVMVLTSLSDARTRHRALGLGASAFVSKHEPASHLLAEVRELAARYLRGELPPRQVGAESGAHPGASSDAADAAQT
jgi:DNA-binding response OmpR family regulator